MWECAYHPAQIHLFHLEYEVARRIRMKERKKERKERRKKKEKEKEKEQEQGETDIRSRDGACVRSVKGRSLQAR